MHPRANHKASREITHEHTRNLLSIICRKVGLNADGAELLRHQTNAVYLLPQAQVVVKIARPDYDIAHIHRTVELTRWLMRLRFPTVPLHDVDQPATVNGSAATFWRYFPQKRPVTATDLARPLRDLHRLPVPHDAVKLPPLDAISAIRYSLEHE